MFMYKKRSVFLVCQENLLDVEYATSCINYPLKFLVIFKFDGKS